MTVTEAPEQVQLDSLSQSILDSLQETAEQINANVGTLKAAQGDVQGLMETLRKTSENPDVVQWNAVIEELEMKLFKAGEQRDALLKPEAEALKAEAEQGTEGLAEATKELRKTYNAGKTFLEKLLGKEDAAKVLPEVKSLAGAGGGKGTGTRRIRHRHWIIGEKTYENAASAASALDVSTGDFQAAFFTAAGSDDQDKWADKVEFTINERDVVSLNVKPAEKSEAPLKDNSADEEE